jgi:hypothetical protein
MDGVVQVQCGSDAELAKRFMALPATEIYGLRKFPTPPQYRQLVDQLSGMSGQQTYADLVVMAQRDWHIRGQTGCQFARLAALAAADLRWGYLVVRDRNVEMRNISQAIETALGDLRIEVMSLLFPWVTQEGHATSLLYNLVSCTRFWLERDEVINGSLRLHLRYPVTDQTQPVQAWVMAFGPFNWAPNTRRGPYFELVIRVREKPAWIFHRLTQDRDVAHLADVPLGMSDKHWEDRWMSTMRRTRMILGDEPDDVSAAKCTIAIPNDLLRLASNQKETN